MPRRADDQGGFDRPQDLPDRPARRQRAPDEEGQGRLREGARRLPPQCRAEYRERPGAGGSRRHAPGAVAAALEARPQLASAFLARLASSVPNSFDTCGPSIPPITPPSGPFASTCWLTVV